MSRKKIHMEKDGHALCNNANQNTPLEGTEWKRDLTTEQDDVSCRNCRRMLGLRPEQEAVPA